MFSKRIYSSVLLTMLAVLPGISSAATVAIDLYVRDGILETVDGRSLPVLCYADDPVLPVGLPNPEIALEVGDELQLILHNLDDVEHGREIVGRGGGVVLSRPAVRKPSLSNSPIPAAGSIAIRWMPLSTRGLVSRARS